MTRISKILASWLAFGLLACSGIGGGAGGNNPNSNITTDTSVGGKENLGNNEGLDPEWSRQAAAGDPMGGGGADPYKDVNNLMVYFNRLTVECQYSALNQVKIKMEGNVKSGAGEVVFRVVEKPTKHYLDTQTDQHNGGYVSFEIFTTPMLPLKFFMLPPGYPVGPLNTLLPCENDDCVKTDKLPIPVFPRNVDFTYDPKHITAPECPPHTEAAPDSELGIHPNSPLLNLNTNHGD